MASSPMAPGHRIRPLVRPCGGNGSPPSPPPGKCPWSNGRSSTGKLRVGVKWKKKRKRKTKTKQGQSPQVVDTYPATAANRTLKSHSLGCPASSPLGQAGPCCHRHPTVMVCLGVCGLPKPLLHSSFCSVPPLHNLDPCSNQGKAWTGVMAAAANLLHQGDRSRKEEEHCCRVSAHPSCRCQPKNMRRARGST